jgi:hypothetical protein
MEHQGDDAPGHVLVDAGERHRLHIEAGFFVDFAAQAVVDALGGPNQHPSGTDMARRERNGSDTKNLKSADLG